jgi:ribonuclease P protein component
LTKAFSYNKKEKLKSRKQLDILFAKGKSFTVFPVKVWYAYAEEQDNILKTGVGVSSRNFKKAVHRNRVKRLLREAYRTEKQPLQTYLNNTEKKLAVFLLFVDKTLPAYSLVKEKTGLCMQRLIKQLNEVDIKNT